MASIGTPADALVLGSKNPNYKVHIKCDGRLINLAADMPETFSIAMQSEWENRFGGSSPLDSINAILRPIGGNVMSQYLTQQVWVSSAPIELPVQLIFDAENSAFDEVYLPMTKLLEFTVPFKRGGILTSPGPQLGDMTNAVSVRVGRLFFIPDGIVTSAQAQFDTRLSVDGFPIGGQVDLTIRTSQVYSNAEWMNAVTQSV